MNGLRKCDIEYLLSTEDFTNLIVTHLGSRLFDWNKENWYVEFFSRNNDDSFKEVIPKC